MAVEKIMYLVENSNKYYDTNKPWICRNEDISKFNNVIYTCSVVIANLANLFEPIMPESCGKIREYLKIKEKKWEYILIDENLKVSSIEPLFKRIQ